MEVLQKFCSSYGQRISQDKSCILFSNNTKAHTRKNLLDMSNFKQIKILGTFLGVPLAGRCLKLKNYQFLLENINSKLASWKGKQLLVVGPTNLAKSVIEAIPTYFMMTSMLHKMCLKQIQLIQRNFIWGDINGEGIFILSIGRRSLGPKN